MQRVGTTTRATTVTRLELKQKKTKTIRLNTNRTRTPVGISRNLKKGICSARPHRTWARPVVVRVRMVECSPTRAARPRWCSSAFAQRNGRGFARSSMSSVGTTFR